MRFRFWRRTARPMPVAPVEQVVGEPVVALAPVEEPFGEVVVAHTPRGAVLGRLVSTRFELLYSPTPRAYVWEWHTVRTQLGDFELSKEKVEHLGETLRVRGFVGSVYGFSLRRLTLRGHGDRLATFDAAEVSRSLAMGGA